jgi:hypothetical protein
MTYVERLRRSPANFRALTGLGPAEFDALLARVAPAYEQARSRRADRPGRRRGPGAGRKFKTPLCDRLLMLLIYYRTYVTHAFLGFLFGVDDSTVGRDINPLQPLLAGIFRVPERKVELGPDEVRELFFDATEQPIHRPGPGKGQRDYYSGKKKRHTLKHQVVVVRKRKRPGPAPGGRSKPRKVRVAAVSPARGGRVHDKRVYDRTRTVRPPDVPGTGDLGYQGTSPRHPHRKPPKGKLTPRQRRGNRRLSRRRVVAEHAIGKMKIWRVAADRYRNPLRRHTLVMKNIAGLHNMMYA